MRNILLSTATNTSRLLTNVVIFFFLARILTVEDFGIFTYAQTFSIIIVLFVDFGYSLKLPKETAESKNRISEIIGESLFIKTILSVLILVTCLLYIFLVNDPSNYSFLILLFIVSTIFQSFATSFFIAFRSINNFKIESVLVTIYNVLISIAGIIVALLTNNLYYLACVYVVFRGIMFLHILTVFNINFKARWIPVNIYTTLKSLTPYAIHYVLSGLYLSINVVIIKFYINEFDLGIYQAGMKIITGATFMLFVIHQVYIPKFSSIKDQKNFKSYASSINTISILFGIAAFILINLFKTEIILIMFGDKYLILENYIGWFGLLILLRFIGAIYGILLTISNRQKYRTRYLVISVIVLMVMNIILMPIYQIIGSLIALVSAHVVLYTLSIFTIRKQFNSFFVTLHLKRDLNS